MNNNIGIFGFLVYEQKLLLVRRNYGDFSWVLPGGSLEKNENMLDGLAREVNEETGIVTIESATLHSTYYHPQEYSIAFCYYVPLEVLPEKFIYDEKELSEVKLFATNEIPWDNMSVFTRKKVQTFIDNPIDRCTDKIYEY